MAIDTSAHYAKIRKVLLWILFLNWAVALAKIIYGLHSRTSSMTADGFHSLSDGASNIIGLIGIAFACQPKDKDHPYGHKKYETFFSLGIAAILFFIAINLFRQGIMHISSPANPRVDVISFIVMFATMGINLWVMNYEKRKAKELRSDILLSDSLHTKADIFTSISVIITLVLIKSGYAVFDPLITIAIALFIARAGYGIIKHSSRILCDTAAITDVKRIIDIVLAIGGVKSCHQLRTRGRPDDIHIDLHVEVDPRMPIGEAHKISYEIEDAIKSKITEITDVIVHLEPKDIKH